MLPFDPIDEAARQWGERWDGVPAMHAVTSLMRVQQLVIGRLDAILKPHDLSFARYEALVLLTFSSRGSLPLGKMGERLQVHPTSVTSLVDRLEAAGLVVRRRHPDDGWTVLAEITNTPWNERHAYVLPAASSIGRGRALRFRFDKAFHVSPFLPMDLGYDWRFTAPGERLAVHMENFQGGLKVFDATLALERREMSGAALAGALARFPFMTVQVLGAIYWQALRLWARRTPFYAHP